MTKCGSYPPPRLGVRLIITTTLQISPYVKNFAKKIFCKKYFLDYTVPMSIMSLLQTTIPRAMTDDFSKARIDEYAQSLPEDQLDDFYETAMLARRQRSTPSFIYEENYPKTSGGLFADSYDADSKTTISKENLDREANAFLDLLNSEKMQGFNEAQYNEALSPKALDFLKELTEFKQEFGFAPLNVKELEAKSRVFDI